MSGAIPVLVAVMTVVSDNGEMWLPQADPEKIAPKTGRSSGNDCGSIGIGSPDSDVIMGTAIGIISAKLPHADPVAIVHASDTKKNMVGNNHSGMDPMNNEARYWPVPT